MRTNKQFLKSIALVVLLFSGFAAGTIAQDSTTIVTPESETPTILTTTPTDGEMNADLDSNIEITFNSDMDEATINDTTLLLHATSTDSMQDEHGMMSDPMSEESDINDSEKTWQNTADAINGTISYSNKVAVFSPDMELKEGTLYTFTVTSGVKNMEDIALENDYTWSFKTMGSSDSTYSDMQENNNSMEITEYSEGTTMDTLYTSDTKESTLNDENNIIDLGKAGQFVILAKTSVNNESTSRITGQIGEGSKADSLNNETANDAYSVRQTQNTLVRNAMVQNTMVQEEPNDTPSPDVTEALEDMMTAYSDALMQNGDDSTSQMNENFHDADLSSGIHEWSDSLTIESDVTLSGSADDVWVFKVGDNLIVDENTVFTLTDGARSDNIFWVVEGEVSIGENANFEGIILSRNEITLEKGAKLNGRMFSQTSITLDDNIVTEPGNMTGQRTSTNR